MGVTLLPEMTLNGGILKGTHLISRPFATHVPSRTVALVSRPSSARRGDFDLLADFIIDLEQRTQDKALARRLAHKAR
jgi:LysR family transcriptional regulator, hydrogen peroxide-inducible genes activator